MLLNSRLLAMVDPSQPIQPALRRTQIIAGRRTDKPFLTAFMAIDFELHKRLKAKPILFRDPAWMAEVNTRLQATGSEYDLCISWDNEWADSVIEQIKRSKSDLVVVPVYNDEDGDPVITDEVWKLLRNSPANVTLIHPLGDGSEQRKVVMAAIKTQDPKFAARNRKTIESTKALAEFYGAKLHLVNAYVDQANFPDRAKIIKDTGVPNDQIHIMAGNIEDVLLTVSKKIKADLLVLAPEHRTGFAAALRGSTINKIIRNIDCDVLAIV